MKNFMKLFFAGALISTLCVGFAACNGTDESGQTRELENEVLPISMSDEIIAFFDENLDIIGRDILNEGGNRKPVHKCEMINSAEEFSRNVLPESVDPLEFPDIDFESYTLVIGQAIGGNSGVYIVSRNLIVEGNTATMNVVLEQKTGGIYAFTDHRRPNFFWGLYPKINAESIIIDVTGDE